MKRLFTFTAALLFSAAIFAQGVQPGPVPTGKNVPQPDSYKQMMLQKSTANKAIKSRWYDYAGTLDDILGGISVFNYNFLFPDTTILVNYGSSGYSGPWIHHLGNMFDPVSTWFNDPSYFPTDLKVTANAPYTLDSVAMNFIYFRDIPNANIVDTLRFQIAIDPIGGTGINFPRGGWLGSQMPQFGADTVWYKRMLFTPANYTLTATNKFTYDVLLNETFLNDTLDDGTHWAQFATPFANIPAGYKVGVMATFIPGYSWVANVDTLANKNSMYFFSYEENGDETYPNYEKGEYNCSYIAADASLDPADGWFGRCIPTWAWTAPYGYENHLIFYHVTANDISGVDPIQNGNLTLQQNYPNPAANSTTIVYSLNQATDVNLTVYDITGKLVMERSEGLVGNGQHEISLDLSKLNAGVYFFTLQAGDSKLSRKMIVQR